jgi:integrase
LLDLLEKPRLGIKEPTKERVRGGLRFLKEALGELTPAELTRERVTEFLDLLALRPAKLGEGDSRLSLRELTARYADRPDVPRLSQKTLEAYNLALNARWREAQSEGAISKDLPSPFSDRKFKRQASGPRTAKGFSPEELKAFFSMSAFQNGERPTRGKGETIFWLPLLLMFTGARPEEVAQLLVTDILQDDRDGKWLIRFTDGGIHPVKGRQSLKTEGHESGRRTFPVPEPLIALGLLEYREHLIEEGETALFPLLRRKGKRSGIYASFGEWMCEHIYENGVLSKGAGRQPMREFRHTWTTAARKSQIPREAMEYIQGHAAPGGGSAHEGYGERDALGDWIVNLRFPVDVGDLVPRWRR